MIILGMLIGDRYEILDKIGTGGMSDVYKAKDHKLNRLVAVKVLKQEFNENTNFVSKFRVEAQAAAGLMHSNIVNVYDVGEEDGIYYIVMELVEGITLKNYIEKKSRLSIKEAISIAIQVSMGIEAAHNNHIIHRDIKPQNIMISKDGKVKVTDFGIAKAATSNTITSNVMGSVHYTSPEQARGGFSDEKSDIYSLGCTLFEMLTGHVPFDGETTVAIAIKHIQDEMPSAREYVSEIPVSVEKIIYKCTQKSPDRRYQSMAELIIDLKKSLITPDEDFVTMVDVDTSAATKALTEEDLAEIKERTGTIAVDEVHMRLNEEAKAKKKIAVPLMWDDEEDEEDESEEYEADEDDDDEYDDDDMDPKMERITTILAIVAAVIIGIIALVLVANAVGIFKGGSDDEEQQIEQTQDIEMVDVVGMDVEVAKVTLEEIYMVPEIEYQESEEIPENKVISQSIEAGKMVAQGSTVKLVVSSGVAAVEIPDVVGKEESEAVSILYEAGFKVSTDTDYSDDVEEGMVISMNPAAGEKVAEETMITLIVSMGPEVKKTSVPDLRGLSESAAKDKLAGANLKAGTVSEDYSDSVTAGCVISQSYSPDMEVEEGTAVDFVLSLGKKEIVYQYVGSINAPTGYVNGTTATITLTSADGESRTFTTNVFPFNINETGFKSATGTVSISGVKTETSQEPKLDANGNPVLDANGAPIYETVETQVPADFGSQAVNFTQVQ
ncbi:MAG: Stk1 family PASTA domain-containing Ser/Thr kinase [Lachnospiraceae bacterium]|nr:Stk1 family PASTA domain-containing Ser/Thr kinase [Lachnospiraceae bacterium]